MKSAKIDSIISKWQTVWLSVLVGLTPIFLLPITIDFFAPAKKMLILVCMAALVIGWLLRSISQQKLTLIHTPATTPLLLLGGTFLLSSFLQTPQTRQALVGEAGVMVSLVVILVVATSSGLSGKVADWLFKLFLGSMSVASAFTLLQFTQLPFMLTKWAPLQNSGFNLTGGALAFIAAAIPLLSAVIALLFLNKKSRTIFNLTTVGLLLVGATIAIAVAVSNRSILMPWVAAWLVAVRTMQNPVAVFLGSGPNTFTDQFILFKPVELNYASTWGVIFPSSANMFFHLLTTVGLLGTGFYLWAGITSLTAGFKKINQKSWLGIYSLFLGLSLLIQLLLPPSLMSLLSVFVGLLCVNLVLINADEEAQSKAYAPTSLLTLPKKMITDRLDATHQSPRVWQAIGAAATLFLLGFFLLINVKAYLSEVFFYASLQAAQKNDGTNTYQYQQRAITLKPYEAQYHMAYSQTNLALANSISSQENLSEADRTTVTQLVEQSIRSAKVAIELNPNNAIAWQNLAVIYQQLIGLVEGADQWSVATYQQAMQLDPTNPQLSLDLGGVFYGLEQYPQALQYFTQAAQLKPNWPNAYYNLAAAYQQTNQYAQATQAMNIVVQLLDPTTEDFKVASQELEELRKLAAEAAEAQPGQADPTAELEPDETSSTLTEPSPLPSPVSEPIDLPQDAAPEVSQ